MSRVKEPKAPCRIVPSRSCLFVPLIIHRFRPPDIFLVYAAFSYCKMLHMNPVNSRATATVTTLWCFPRPSFIR